jgi:HAD superfamily hydrolase (TIGR01509 family)
MPERQLSTILFSSGGVSVRAQDRYFPAAEGRNTVLYDAAACAKLNVFSRAGATGMHMNANADKAGSQFPFCERLGIRAVVFDWDGVLVDSAAIYYRAYELVLRDAGVTTTTREIYLREGQPTGQLIAALLTERGVPFTEAGVQELVERRREYDAAAGERKFFSGVCELLERLRYCGYRLGMVTGSSRKSVSRVLASQRDAFFDVVITADDVTRPKPDPQPFLLAAQALRLAPAECLVVENAPFGIRAARAAGCRALGIATTLPADDLSDADWVVQNHRELEVLLSSAPPHSEPPHKEKASRGQAW